MQIRKLDRYSFELQKMLQKAFHKTKTKGSIKVLLSKTSNGRGKGGQNLTYDNDLTLMCFGERFVGGELCGRKEGRK